MRSMVLAVLMLFGTGAIGKEDPAWAQPMADLDRMIGIWEVTTFSVDEGGRWRSGSMTVSRITSELDGAVLREEAEFIDPANHFRLISYWSWDQFRSTYRVAVMDRESGLMDIYEGAPGDAGLVLTNTQAGTTFVAGDGNDRSIRMRQTFPSRGRYTLHIDSSDGNGWREQLRMEYRKYSSRAASAAAILEIKARQRVSGENML